MTMTRHVCVTLSIEHFPYENICQSHVVFKRKKINKKEKKIMVGDRPLHEK